MDIPQETSLVAKVLWSAAIVLGLAAVAERVSTRIAGILAGAPTSAVLVYFFVGQDMGISYVVESVPHGIAAFTATLAFVLTYYRVSLQFSRYATFSSSLLGIVVFLAVASVLVIIPFNLASAVAVTTCALVLAIWLFRKIEFVPVTRPVHYTAGLLMLRGGLAAMLIVSVITLAENLGTRWTGLLTGFPATLLPTLLIIHVTYGTETTHAVIRSLPVGMGSVVLYILSVPLTFPVWGIYGGTAASLAVSFVYLTSVILWGSFRTAGKSKRTERS